MPLIVENGDNSDIINFFWDRGAHMFFWKE